MKVRYSPTGKKIRSKTPDTDFSVSIIEKLVSNAGSDTFENIDDYTRKVTTSSSTDVVFSITAETNTLGYPSPVITNLTPNIISMDSNNNVTRIANGIARLSVKNSYGERKYSFNVSQKNSTKFVYKWNNWKVGSFCQYHLDLVNYLTNGKTPSDSNLLVFTTEDYNITNMVDGQVANKLYNTNNFTYGILDTSATCVNKLNFPIHLISPRHAICAAHVSPTIGQQFAWIDKNGLYKVASVTGIRNITTSNGTDSSNLGIQDTCILYLSKEITNVDPYYFLPSDYNSYINLLSSQNNYLEDINFPVFTRKPQSDGKLKIRLLNNTSLKHTFNIHDSFSNSNSNLETWRSPVIGGDSGSGIFTVLNDKGIYRTVLLGSFYTANGGSNYSYYLTQIESAMNALAFAANDLTVYSLNKIGMDMVFKMPIIPSLNPNLNQYLRSFIIDPEYCYSDLDGNVKATKDGQVAMVLDSNFFSYRINDGNFNNSNGWGVSQPSGTTVFFNTTSVQLISTNTSTVSIKSGIGLNAISPMTIGETYRIEFDVNITSGSLQVTDGETNLYKEITTSGKQTFCIVAKNNYLMFKNNSAVCNFTLSNLRIMALGISLRQETLANRPRLRRGTKNWIPNSGVSGVQVSNNIMPTNWAITGINTRQILGTGTINIDGKNHSYIDVRFAGTNNTAATQYLGVNFCTYSNIKGHKGQTWTGSVYSQLIAGSIAGIGTVYLRILETANNSYVNLNSTIHSFSSTLTRRACTLLVNGATTTNVSLDQAITIPVNLTYDFSLRFVAPQMELGNVATPAVITTSGPLSNTTGKYWLDFDGTSSNMVFSKSPFASNSLNHYVATAGFNFKGNGLGTLLNIKGSANETMASVYYNTGSLPMSTWRDESNVEVTETFNTVITGADSLLVNRRSNNAFLLRSQSVARNRTATLGNIAITETTIGNQAGTDYFYGGLYGLHIADTFIADTESTKIISHATSLMGLNT